MSCNQRSLRRLPPAFSAAALWLVCLACAAAEPPQAIVSTEAEPSLLFSLAPALARLENPAFVIHTPGSGAHVADYLTQLGARRVWLIDPARRAPVEWRKRFETIEPPAETIALELAKRCWAEAPAVVLASDLDPELALTACLLATARGVPAFSLAGPIEPPLRDWVRKLAPSEIICVGDAASLVKPADFPDCKLTEFKTAAAVLAAYETALGDSRKHLVVLGSGRQPEHAAPLDVARLVPQYAAFHRAAVAILNAGEDTEPQIERLLAERYPSVRYVTLWGDTASLPDGEVEDPVAAAGLETKLTERTFAVPPLAGLPRREPCQFRVGRITGDSLSALSLLVARNLRPPSPPADAAPRVLILANINDELPIMETISRTTVQTLARAGWRVDARYGWAAEWYRRRGERWGADLVLYEGHTANLDRAVYFARDQEPVATGLYVFQGCKTLIQPQVAAMIRNGAAGVVGTTTKTYSASGAALAKVLVDSLVLDDMDAGTGLMVARNFMLALAELEERRQHQQTSKMLRSGMTFALWGDPTWKPPRPAQQIDPGNRVHAVRDGPKIELRIPESWPSRVEVDEYSAQVPTGAKLAGVYGWEDEAHTRRQLPPLYFAIVPLPDHAGAEPPRLSTRLAQNHWTSLWDPRNRWLYLLVHGSAKAERDAGTTFSFRIKKDETP